MFTKYLVSRNYFLAIFLFLSCGFFSSSDAQSSLRRLCRTNCTVLVIGDSFVSGVGDDRPKNENGYVGRLRTLMPSWKFRRIGIPGGSTNEIYRAVLGGIGGEKRYQVTRKLSQVDFVIVDAGRNDYWEGLDQSDVVRSLSRLTSLVDNEIYARYEKDPFIALMMVAPSSRSYQAGWLDQLNKAYLSNSINDVNGKIRVDLLSEYKPGYDGLHPNDVGYEQIACFVAKYFASILYAGVYDGSTFVKGFRRYC
jgi:lysophospholipase L1-like esterase